jgi:NAD(P)-dependent dehydrogenase (short-subunit alcohol dehydrogenase family)
MDLSLKGKRALVTGGSKGIGRAIALALADEGCHVSICARSQKEIDGTLKEIGSRGVKAHGGALDVRNAGALRSWVEESAKALGGIDVLVPNVSALALDKSAESWRSAFEIDLMHTVTAVEAALPHIRKNKGGAIVIISSISGIEVDFASYPYGSMKAALTHYSKGLSAQLAPEGIRCNAISPGNIYFEGGVWPTVEKNMPDLFKMVLGLNKTGRMGTAEEVAYCAVMLASPKASFMYGTNLVVDGAMTNRMG